MKTKEELNALKNEVEVLSAKLAELTDEEMMQVTGGNWWPDYYGTGVYNSTNEIQEREERLKD